jgi:L-alanine-DL-glutamate epimerase-like enolase superfamily enzyme
VIADGQAQVPERPGIGMVWDKTAVDHYRMRGSPKKSDQTLTRAHG